MNEIYPADCVMYRFLVNPSQLQYRVDGHEDVVNAKPSPAQEDSSEVSLQLKLAKGAAPSPQQTPSRIESSEKTTSSRRHSNAHIDDEPPVALFRPSETPFDALDDAIEEAKAVKDLVSVFKAEWMVNVDEHEATRSRRR